MRFQRYLILLVCSSTLTLGANAAGFTKEQSVDFFRDVSSRNLKGLATRSDGRLLVGPTLTPTGVDLGVDLVWDMEAIGPAQWLIATGPDGKILEITQSSTDKTMTSRVWADLGAEQVFKISRLTDGRLIAGTSPSGLVVLFSAEGEKIASVDLEGDSVFDIVEWDEGRSVLVATGNPGRIMRIDLAQLVASFPSDKATEEADSDMDDKLSLADRGVSEFGAIRDRNVRTLAITSSGQVIAGSAPSGNLYRFAPTGGDPVILLDHDIAEITDIHISATGDVFVAVVHSPTPQSNRVIAAAKDQTPPDSSTQTTPTPTPAPSIMQVAPTNTFSGRSTVIKLPAGDGLPETIVSRAGLAIYRIESRGDILIFPGGDSGELVGYDQVSNRAITFAGSESAQLTDIVPTADQNVFLILTNNPAGVTFLDFDAKGPRSAETRRLNLRSFTKFGALRFNRLRGVSPEDIQVSLNSNRGSDDAEGWSGWTPLAYAHGGWKTDELMGEYAKIKVELPETIPASSQIDGGTLFHLPANRRPSLKTFQVVTPNYGLKVRPESNSSAPRTLGQLIGAEQSTRSSSDESTRAAANLLASQIVPFPGVQLVTWLIDDDDGDTFVATYSIRHEDSDRWIDIAVDTDQNWVQFDRATLSDGVYFTRLVASETAPRPLDQRLQVTFETDDLVVDQTGPTIQDVVIRQPESALEIEVLGMDSRSLLQGIKISLNNGRSLESEQTVDGILDQQTERFVITISPQEAKGATALQITLHDDAGNQSSRWVEID